MTTDYKKPENAPICECGKKMEWSHNASIQNDITAIFSCVCGKVARKELPKGQGQEDVKFAMFF